MSENLQKMAEDAILQDATLISDEEVFPELLRNYFLDIMNDSSSCHEIKEYICDKIDFVRITNLLKAVKDNGKQ